uniref:U29-Theraphotoxin-Ct1a_1 n=1 Tax=Coremiocnemis tropix TaxID=1904443 RepID=A0A482ZCL1_CORTR
MRVLLIIAGLVLLLVVSNASQMKEQSSLNEVLSAMFAMEDPQERDDCLGMFSRVVDPKQRTKMLRRPLNVTEETNGVNMF